MVSFGLYAHLKSSLECNPIRSNYGTSRYSENSWIPQPKLWFAASIPDTFGRLWFGSHNVGCVCVCARADTCSVLSNSLLTVALQVSLSMGFSRQEYWTGLPFLPPENLPDPGIQPVSYISCIGRLILYYLCHLGSHNTGCFWGSKWDHLHSVRHCLLPPLGRDGTQIPGDFFRQSFSSFLMDLNSIPFWIKRWQCLRVFPHPSGVWCEYSIKVPYIKTVLKQLRIFQCQPYTACHSNP